MRKLVLGFAFLFSTPSLVNAAVLGLDIPTGGTPSNSFDKADYTLGWEFSLSDSVVLTALGTWDQNSDGLNVDQKIQLWRSSGELLASTTINNSATQVSSTSNEGSWLFTNVEDTLLSAGNYLIGVDRLENSGDAFQTNLTSVNTDSRITWLGGRYAGLDYFGFPDKEVSGTQYFGPNLMIKSVSVPEPGTLGILGVSLAGLWMTRRRKV